MRQSEINVKVNIEAERTTMYIDYPSPSSDPHHRSFDLTFRGFAESTLDSPVLAFSHTRSLRYILIQPVNPFAKLSKLCDIRSSLRGTCGSEEKCNSTRAPSRFRLTGRRALLHESEAAA